MISRIFEFLRTINYYRRVVLAAKKSKYYLCPICKGKQPFWAYLGAEPIWNSNCPTCGSLKRHRLFWLMMEQGKSKIAEPVLHFAPEIFLKKRLKESMNQYKTADLIEAADLRLDITNTEIANAQYNTVIANHVLEHVTDPQKALKEVYRILIPGGRFIFSTPVVEGWPETFENANLTTEDDRERYFGQSDHLRIFGSDIRQKISAAGFAQIEEIYADGLSAGIYGLERGETIFLCHKAGIGAEPKENKRISIKEYIENRNPNKNH